MKKFIIIMIILFVVGCKDVNVDKVENEDNKIRYINGAYYIDNILIVNKSYPLDSNYIPFNTYKTVDFNTLNCTTCINKDAYYHFLKMQSDALSIGLKIWIQSGYRSFEYQSKIYNRYKKYYGDRVDEFSARPGYSEHQSGYAIDLNSVDDSFITTKEGVWVKENAYKYGFIIRYPFNKQNITGYQYEPWHLRFVGQKLSALLFNNGEYITLEEYFNLLSFYENA